MSFLYIKFAIYLATLVLGYLKYVSSGERKYLLFSFLGIVDFSTNLLDIYVFTSNLELFIVHNLLTVGSYFVFFYFIKNITISPKLLFSVYSIMLLYAGILFKLDWPKASSNLYSQYGFLNTYEYSIYSCFAAVLCLLLCTFVLLKIFQNETVKLNILFIIFGIIIYYTGELLKYGLGIYLLKNANAYNDFGDIIIPIKLYASKCLILLGLTWKR